MPLSPQAIHDVLHNALALERARRFDEAEAAYRRVLAAQPGNADALHLLGVLVHRLDRTAEAIEFLEKASRRAPRDVHILDNLGQLYKAAGRQEDAKKKFRRAIALDPAFADAHNNLGIALMAEGRHDEADPCFRTALRIRPDHPQALYNLATLLTARGRYAEAIPIFRQVLAAHPDLADAHNNLGHALLETGAGRDAESCFHAALSRDPAHVDALANLGKINLLRYDTAAAEDFLRRAIAANPDHARALSGLGVALLRTGRHGEAMEAQRRALSLDPTFDEAFANLAVLILSTCSWAEYESLMADLDLRTRAAIDGGHPPPEFPLLSLHRSADPGLNFHVARLRSADIEQRSAAATLPPVQAADRAGRTKIVLGYLSTDFRTHPVGQLVRPLFGLHDRDRFEVRAYSNGPDDGGDYRKAFEREADAFIDIRTLTDREAAERIRADGVDILVDLGGYTQGNRLGVAALRPAPLAFSYVGFAGTIGGRIFDYTVVDPIVVPPANARFYSEKLVVVPPCYLIHDREPIADKRLTRADEGLPEKAFVFCSFNEARKLTPTVFDAWMGLLRDLPETVLWLYRSNAIMVDNLSREAAARGVDPARLIFGARRPKPEHLARLALADLGLDTMPFNGGVTTSDALWAGLPVIAVRGTNCASLGSASKLAAIGLAELVADDLAGAMAMTRRLAGDRNALAAVKAKLAANRLTTPLFDSERFVRTLERGYEEAFRLCRAGESPRHIVLDDGVRGLYDDKS